MQRFQTLSAVALFSLLGAPCVFAQEMSSEEHSLLERRVRVSFLTASRGNYVFRGSDSTKVSNLGLVFGKTFGDSGRSYAIRPYGIEADGRVAMGTFTYLSPAVRLVPTGMRLTPSSAEQTGWDAFASLTYGVLPQVSPGLRAGFEAGFRFRHWQLEDGPFPDSSHAGFIVSARAETKGWEALFEAGLMAAGIGVPAALGVQRDASTLRARITAHRSMGAFQLSPWVEFFHTHRNFYGASVIAGQSSLFVDEASLLIGLGVTL